MLLGRVSNNWFGILSFFLLFNFYDYLIFRIPKIILKKTDILQGVLTRNEIQIVCLVDCNSNYIGIGICIVGGQDLSFCVGLKTPFTNKSTSKEEKTFGKAP